MEPHRHRYRFVIGGLLLLLNFSLGMNLVAVAPVLPVITGQFGVGRGEAGLLMSLVLVTQAALSLPGGLLVGRLPMKPLFGAGWLLGSAMVLTPLAGGFYELLALRVVYSLSFAVLWPATAPVMMRWFSRHELPLINSLNFTAFPLGIAVGTFIAVPLSRLVGWEQMLAIVASPALAGALLWAVAGGVPSEPAEASGRLNPREVLKALKSRFTLLIAIADGGAFAQYMALTTWLPSFYNEARGMDLATAGFVAGLMPLAGMLAVLASGYMTMRVGLRKPFVIFPGVVLGLAGLGTFLADSMPLIYLSVIAVGLASFFYLSPLYTMPLEAEGRSPEQVALIWGMAFAVSSVFAIMSPLVVGAMADELDSFKPGFVIWSVAAWSLLLAGLLLPETGPGRRRAPHRLPGPA